MRQKIFRLLPLSYLLFLTACISMPSFLSSPSENTDNTQQHFFSSFPSGGELVVIGVAGRRSNPQETIRLALENAAVKVGKYYRVGGEYAIQNYVGSGAFDYSHETHAVLHFDPESSKQYVESLKYDIDIDTFEYQNALFIRATYPASLPVPVSYRPGYNGEDRKPSWVENPPIEIDGYKVGVGFSNRRSSMADAVNNSRDNAIFAIIKSINTVTRSDSMMYMESGSLFGYKTSHENITYSFGTLDGFYVLDFWIDPKLLTVWTLAIAK